MPWGGRDYGMETLDVDASLIGHWPDPSSLLYAWLFDADRWAKDGFDLWCASVNIPRSGTRREYNTSLVHAITAYEYEPDEETLERIKGMLHGEQNTQGLTSLPLATQHPGPIWEPTWLSRAYELFPDDKKLKEFIVTSADAAPANLAGTWSMALCATAWQITGDKKYLERHAGTLGRMRRRLVQDATGRWQDYGLAPGPGGFDHQFALQWHRFAKALEDAGLQSLALPDEPGHYWCSVTRFDNEDDIRAGNESLDSTAGARTAREACRRGTPIVDGRHLRHEPDLVGPGGQVAWRDPRIAMSKGRVPSLDARRRGSLARRSMNCRRRRDCTR